ncbi:MAG: LemA family protein [Cytophagales bacterium]|nr:MAG: LemA family protein [Cytophagales bacterium]
MKKLLIIGGIVLVVVIFLYNFFAGSYNNMVSKNEEVKSAWAQVQNVYQRRMDLIPNLVNTVKGYADFEKETLTKIVEARAKATSVNISPQNLSPEEIKKFQGAQDGLSQALGKLLSVVENYPDLKANQNFLELQSQLEGTENRIAVERQKYNVVVKEYNSYVLTFPRNILRGMYGFDSKGYFEATAGAEKAPEVKF